MKKQKFFLHKKQRWFQITNQTTLIEKLIIICIQIEKMTDKKLIYDRVQKEVGCPRPSIRRAAQNLVINLELTLKILKTEGRKR